eukprot:4923730-Pleurochrysis_carterae.AAC.5
MIAWEHGPWLHEYVADGCAGCARCARLRTCARLRKCALWLVCSSARVERPTPPRTMRFVLHMHAQGAPSRDCTTVCVRVLAPLRVRFRKLA